MSYRPREGGGSIFALRFPIVPREQREGARSPISRRVPVFVRKNPESKISTQTREEVIVVDDNLINTKVLCALLKRENVVPVALLSEGFSALQFLIVCHYFSGGKV